MIGGKFTWQRNNQGQVMISKRLDRVIMDAEWRTSVPEAAVELLPRVYSDHHPLLVRPHGLVRGAAKKLFCFE
ncbi:unnamed protein product [Cuscuta campestris]|uniref:Endonuclease/exonuclease/phosphatase domain-containing protein n=1 Tax=Cuscuta campestris TaxID=132261 RepID=A0A484LWK4_9ASTE|nr:unnamed protein product [Cuscuta campestris]